MSRFFDYFPTIGYDFTGKIDVVKEYNTVTNVLFRVSFIEKIMEQTTSYYDYFVEEGETPEILADKLYGDPELHWVIIYANRILDPQYDWPLSGDTFTNYIIDKYGSIEYAQTNIHHYEKIYTRYDSRSRETTTRKYEINGIELISLETGWDVPYESYDTMAESVFEAFDIGDGTTCQETITRNTVTLYDYEDELNEQKRSIKVINPVFLPLIRQQFEELTRSESNNFEIRNRGLRTVR